MRQHFTILVAEDDPNDVVLYHRAFERGRILGPTHFVHQGREVLDYLEGLNHYADRIRFPLPGLILMDIKMPRMNGLDVLQWMRNCKQFQGTPVIMVTSSAMSPDVQRARELGANGYYVKRSNFEGLTDVMKSTMFLAPES